MQLAWVTVLLWGLFGRAELPRILTVSAPPPSDDQIDWRPLAEKLAAAGLEAQRAWLEQGPLVAAVRELHPADGAQRAEIERQLGAARARLAEGQPLSADDIGPLLVVRGRLEQAALERLAREYRIATYNAFRGDRAEFDRRRQAWDDVQSAWRLAGSRPEQRRTLIAWLRSAAAATQQGGGNPLPAAPRFAAAPEMAAEVGASAPSQPGDRAIGPSAGPSPAPGVASRAERRPSRPPVARRDARRGAEQSDAAPPAPSSAARRPVEPEPGIGGEPPRITARRPVVSPRPSAMAPAPGLAADQEPNVAAIGGVGPARRPTSPPAAASAAPAATQAEPRPNASTSQPLAARRRGRSPRPRPTTDDAPRPVPPGELRIASAPDHAALATVDGDPVTPPVQVNLEELSVRIVGYNFALAALEARLADRRGWSAAELEPVVQQLAELGQLRSMLAGYREFVVETAQVRLGQLEPLQPVVTSVAARISSARADLINAASADAGPAEAAELARLESLSRRLAYLAERGGR